MRYLLVLLLTGVLHRSAFSQLAVARDTIMVIESGVVLKMPWANGINYGNVSSVDLNLDGKKDLVVFDRLNQYSEGRFRCFINTGSQGATMYRAEAQLSYSFPRAFSWAVFYDYDNDGKEDLLCSGNSEIMVYRNVSTAAITPSFTLVKQRLMVNLTPGGTPHLTSLFASVIGVPGIADVDGDGDMDILSFSSQGTFVELNRNMSMEKFGNADSLVFDYASTCWGNVAESNCSVDFSICGASKAPITISGHPGRKDLHAGSCLTCFDSDGDGDKDLLMGDIACNDIQYVHNNGTPTNPSFNDTTKIYPNYKNNNTTPVRINNFPCVYYLDVDGDGKKDLLAAPNAYGSENFKSLWYYRNASTTGTVNFQFVKKNFLQDEMIEVGQNSFPVLFDYDKDGKKDLLVGTYGYYIGNSLSARLTLYKNTGTPAQPSYSLISKDYANLSAQTNINCAIPTVGDIDGDGDDDICIGTSSGQIHWLENTAGANNVCNFSVFHNNPFQFTTNSAAAAPQLFDLDSDGKLDLLIGTKNGRIAFYKNTGTATAASFSLITNTLGNVDVTDDPNLFGFDGYAVPFFYTENGVVKLLAGSVSGRVFQYTVPSGPQSPFNFVSSFVNGLYEGGQSSVWFEDVNNDGKRDLFVGNASGGLSFFSSKSTALGLSDANAETLSASLQLFPNPASTELTVKIASVEFDSGRLEMFDLLGNKVKEMPLTLNNEVLDLTALCKGVYVVKVSLQNINGYVTATKRLIKE